MLHLFDGLWEANCSLLGMMAVDDTGLSAIFNDAKTQNYLYLALLLQKSAQI